MKERLTIDQIRSALAYISPNLPRDEWASIGMAIKSELGEEGLALFDQWSSGGDNYKQKEVLSTWGSIKAGGKVTIGTLIYKAKNAGFKLSTIPSSVPPSVAAKQAEQEAERRDRIAAEAIATEQAKNDAASEAEKQWQRAKTEGQAPYLTIKGIKPYGVRFDNDGVLLVPVCDINGKIWNLQRIQANGCKLFLKGGRKSGLMHKLDASTLGNIAGDNNASVQKKDVYLICEGYATGASLREACEYPVFVAFDAGNLKAVAQAVRKHYPGALLVICGDNDQATERTSGTNPGREKAKQAAKAVECGFILPQFSEEASGKDLSDFNDLHQAQGLEAVRKQVQACIDAMNSQLDTASYTHNEKKSQLIKSPPEDSQGMASYAGNALTWDRFQVTDDGVFYVDTDQDGRNKSPQWICGRLDVTASTCDEDGQNWGYLLEFKNRKGQYKSWSMPARMLAGDGSEYRAALLNMGLTIASTAQARNRLTQYLQTRNPPDIVRCVDRVGWHGRAYVLPKHTIVDKQENKDRIVYQTESQSDNPFKQRGTLDVWRDKIGVFCLKNSRLIFSVSCALAGVLVRPSGIDSGGFHLRGDSSSGKTTALKVAASVWGGPGYMQRWRSTDNALESIAAQHCDGLLILDEIAQVEAKNVGECAYMLANETGKARSTRTGHARPRLTWKILFLSAGEISLSQHMAEGGKRTKAGQELRLADIPADAGAGFGLFNDLHGQASGADFSSMLTKACELQHGTLGLAFLHCMVDKVDELRKIIHSRIDSLANEWIPNYSSGQVQRVVRRFALVAVAGELASEAGLTGWPIGAASEGVKACFDAWILARGGIGNAEEGYMLSQVQRLLSERGAGNFSWFHRAADDRAPNPTERWGYRRLVSEDGQPINTNSDHMREYGETITSKDAETTSSDFLVFTQIFKKHLCQGFDPSTVAKFLHKRGHLVPEQKSGRLDRKERLPGLGLARVYRIKSSIFHDELSD